MFWFFSTDFEIPVREILNYYKSRFQIKSLYSDSKQYIRTE